MASPNGSSYKHYLALASNESYISIVDLSNLFGKLPYRFILMWYVYLIKVHHVMVFKDVYNLPCMTLDRSHTDYEKLLFKHNLMIYEY